MIKNIRHVLYIPLLELHSHNTIRVLRQPTRARVCNCGSRISGSQLHIEASTYFLQARDKAKADSSETAFSEASIPEEEEILHIPYKGNKNMIRA